ncbi:MAG: ATP-binding cassette domain-containing protein, partial [Planctomycetota bacterium]
MLKVEHLVKQFSLENETIRAVDGLSFLVRPGEAYGLLGPNGAGKTTTLRMILGLIDPDEGYAEVDQRRTSDDPDAVKSRIGFVSATDGVYPWSTVREMLLFFGDLYNVSYQRAVQRVDYLADVLDITHLLERRAGGLSTGQRQRVTLARGLIHDPPVVLLDEPTRGLDVVGVQVIFDYISYLRQQG